MPSKFIRSTLASAILTLWSLTSQANEGVISSIETRSQQLTDLSDLIWDLAEVGYQEIRSSEALKMAINKIKHEEVEAKIILSDIGMINETDVSLAKASNAILIGFNVKPNREAKKLAEEQKIDIKFFNIIYEALEYVEKSLSGLLEPDVKETILGSAEIQKIFNENI